MLYCVGGPLRTPGTACMCMCVCVCACVCVCVFVCVGLMIRPKGELMEIIYNIEDTESWDKYIQKLDNFLARKECACMCVCGVVCGGGGVVCVAGGGGGVFGGCVCVCVCVCVSR